MIAIILSIFPGVLPVLMGEKKANLLRFRNNLVISRPAQLLAEDAFKVGCNRRVENFVAVKWTSVAKRARFDCWRQMRLELH